MIPMKKIFIVILLLPLVSGCRALLDTGGAAAGGFLGNKLSRGDPLITAASAGAGALLAEGGQALANNTKDKAFKQGVETGRAQAAKEFYWDLQARQRTPQAQ